MGNGHTISQYPNKMVMVMREHKEIEFKSDTSEEDKMPQLKDYSNVVYPIDGEICD